MTEDRAAKELIGEPAKAINAATLSRLETDAQKCTRAGRWLFGIAIVIGIALIAIAYHLTGVYVDDLERAKDPPLMLVLLLVRGTLFGSLSIGFLYGIFTVGNAYIDQATRFRKRLYSAHMLNYAFETFGQEIKDGEKVKVDDLVRLFYAWNATVDSAFSRVAFQRASKNLVIGGAGQRIAVEDPPTQSSQGHHPPPGDRMQMVGIPIPSDWLKGQGSNDGPTGMGSDSQTKPASG